MSVVIGYVENGRVLFATDSQRTNGGVHLYHTNNPETANVVAFPDGILCAVTGDQNIKNQILSHPEWLRLPDGAELTQRWLLENFIPRFYDALEKRDYLADVSSGHSRYNGTLMIAKGGVLYFIDNDFAVIRIPRFALIGNAAELAYPFVAAYDGNGSIEKTFFSALSCASDYNRKTSAPFYLYETGTDAARELKGEDDDRFEA